MATSNPNTTTTAQEPPTQSTTTTKRKRKAPSNQIISQITLRNPQWSYIHLQHLNPHNNPNGALDNVTAHLHLTSALSSFLGLHGAAIPIDILKLENQDVWIRVPAADKWALIAAVGGWVSSNGQGGRVKGWSHWNASAPGRDSGQDLFED